MVLVQIHTTLHYEHFIPEKTTYILYRIVLQTLISAVSPLGIHARMSKTQGTLKNFQEQSPFQMV